MSAMAPPSTIDVPTIWRSDFTPMIGTAGYGTSLTMSDASATIRKRMMVCHGKSASVVLSVRRMTVWL